MIKYLIENHILLHEIMLIIILIWILPKYTMSFFSPILFTLINLSGRNQYFSTTKPDLSLLWSMLIIGFMYIVHNYDGKLRYHYLYTFWMSLLLYSGFVSICNFIYYYGLNSKIRICNYNYGMTGILLASFRSKSMCFYPSNIFLNTVVNNVNTIMKHNKYIQYASELAYSHISTIYKDEMNIFIIVMFCLYILSYLLIASFGHTILFVSAFTISLGLRLIFDLYAFTGGWILSLLVILLVAEINILFIKYVIKNTRVNNIILSLGFKFCAIFECLCFAIILTGIFAPDMTLYLELAYDALGIKNESKWSNKLQITLGILIIYYLYRFYNSSETEKKIEYDIDTLIDNVLKETNQTIEMKYPLKN